MSKYQKKPVIINAWLTSLLLTSAKCNWKSLPEVISKAYEKGDIIFLSDAMLINTLEGQHRSNIDDWVIQGVKGELYPCKPDIFEMTYEKCDE